MKTSFTGRTRAVLMLAALLVSLSYLGLAAQVTPPQQPNFQGQVTEITANYIIFTPISPLPGMPTSFKVYISGSTQYYYMTGATAPLSMGDFGVGVGTAYQDGWLATQIFEVPPPPADGGTTNPPTNVGQTMTIGGTVSEIGSGYFISTWHNQQTGEQGTDRIVVDGATQYVDMNGATVQLKVGDNVQIDVQIQTDGSSKALKVIVQNGGIVGPQPGENVTFGGTISEIGSGYFISSWHNPDTGEQGSDRISFDASTQFVDVTGAVVQIKVGDNVQIDAQIQTDGSKKAFKVTVMGGGGPQPGQTIVIGGTVTEIGSGYFTTSWHNPETGEQGTDKVLVDASTQYVDITGAPVQLKVGDPVQMEVVIQSDGSQKATRVTVQSGGGGGGPQPGEKMTIGGTVIEIGDGFFIASWQNPETGESGVDTLRYDLSSTPIVDETGAPTQLVVGKPVQAEIEIQLDGKPKVLKIIVGTGGGGGPQPGETYQRGGTVIFLGSGYLVAQWTDPEAGKSGQDTIKYDASVPIVDESGATVQLALGQNVSAEIQVQADRTEKVMKIVVHPQGPKPGEKVQVGGEVVFLGSGFIVNHWQDTQSGKTGYDTLYIDATATIKDAQGNTVTLKVGDQFGGEAQVRTDGKLQVLSLVVGGGGNKPGDKVLFTGTVARIWSDSVEAQVRNEDGTTTLERAFFDQNTQIKDRNGNTVTLKTGDVIQGEVQITTDKRFLLLWATTGTGGAAPGDTLRLGGDITFLGNGFVVTRYTDPAGGATRIDTIKYDNTTPIVDANGLTAQLTLGATITATLQIQNDGSKKTLRIVVSTGGTQPGQKVRFGGSVSALWTDSLEIQYDTLGQTKKLRLLRDQTTVIKDQAGAVVTLKVGDSVEGEAETQAGGKLRALTITLRSTVPIPGQKVRLVGSVSALWTDSLEIQYDTLGQTKKQRLLRDQSTTVKDPNGAVVTLKVGDNVEVEAETQTSGILKALTVTVRTSGPIAGQKVRLVGSVSALWTDSLEVQYDTLGQTKKQRLLRDQGTTVKDPNGATVTLKVGDNVEVEAETQVSGKLKALAITVRTSGPIAGQKVRLVGSVSALWTDSLEVQYDTLGQTKKERLLRDQGTTVKDQSGATVTLKVGDNVEVEAETQVSGKLKALTVTVRPAGPKPGDTVNITAWIKAINGNALGVGLTGSATPWSEATVQVQTNTVITHSEGFTLAVADLTVGDSISVRGVVGSDGKSVNATEIRLVYGSYVSLSGVVAALTTDGFDLETRDRSGATVVLKVQLGTGTSIVRQQTGQALTRSDILRSMQVKVRGKVNTSKVLAAAWVELPQPTRQSFDGTVVSTGTNSFVVEYRRTGETVAQRLTVNYTGTTVWLQDDNGKVSAGSVSALVSGAFVRGSGILTEPQTVRADSVTVVKITTNVQVNKFTLIDGKRDGLVFTFKINLNEGTTLAARYATGRMDVSADFKSVKGTLTPEGEAAQNLVLSKLSGEDNKLTGKWSGVLGANTLVSAELYASSGLITGTITKGGTLDTGSQTLKPGDAVSLDGTVSSVSGKSLVLTFTDQYNQQISRPVTVTDRTVYVNLRGDTLRIPVDSLRNRKVTVTGIIQNDLSVLASKIAADITATGQTAGTSSSLPVIAGGRWDAASRKFTLSVDAKKLDSQASGSLALSLTLSADGNALAGDGTLSGGKVTFTLSRIKAGLVPGPGGSWVGNASMAVSGGTKIWPVSLETRLQSDNSVTGNYDIGEGRIKTEILVQNKPPVFQPLPELHVRVEDNVVINVTATDPEGDAITLSAPGLTLAGATFKDNGNGTASLSFTAPKLGTGQQKLTLTFLAADAKGNKTSATMQVEIERQNTLPVLSDFPAPVELNEGVPGSFAVPGYDADGDKLVFHFRGLPSGAMQQGNVVSWLPPFGSAGSYKFTVAVVEEAQDSTVKDYTFTVKAVNRAPTILRIPRIESQAGQSVSFTVLAADPDPGDLVTLAVDQVNGQKVIPPGAAFDPVSGSFSWTPSSQQSGPYKASFVATDKAGLKDKITVDIFIGQASLPPSLTVVDSAATEQGKMLTVTVSATSQSGKKLDFYARDYPRGAVFDKNAHTLTWTPDYQQKGRFLVTVGVGDGSFKTERVLVLNVSEVVQRASLQSPGDFTVAEGAELRFQVNGSYPDGRRVIFDTPSSLPAGAAFDVLSGTFLFRPTYTQAGSYNLTFSCRDSDGQLHSVTSKVTVTDVNRAPRLTGLQNLAVSVGQAVAISVSATDPDSADVLSFDAPSLPQGATFDKVAKPAAFNWTPGVAGNYGITFTVTDKAGAMDSRTLYVTVGDAVNLPPALGDIPDLSVAEGEVLSLVVSASDPENDPVSVFINPMPDNAAFDNTTGVFTFQPDYSQAGMYSLDFVASDGELTDHKVVEITVTDVPVAPTLTAPTQLTVDEGDSLSFQVSAVDGSGNRIPVVSSTLPEGSSLDPSSGDFFWPPTYEQAGQYKVTFLAGDGEMTASQEVTIDVADRNRPPVIFELRDQQVREGDAISFEITTSDPDQDPVTIAIDSTQTPYIQSVEIRNNSVFVFNTALLDKDRKIPSAVFKVTASDGRGGTDSKSIAFKIIRRDSVDVPSLPPGGTPFQYGFPGTGLHLSLHNNGPLPVAGGIAGSETSGSLSAPEPNTFTQLAAAAELPSRYSFLAKSKDKIKVLPFLSEDGTSGGDFYGIRRGWGLDLTSALTGSSLTGLTFEITLNYNDEDVPARDIPEFTEAGISVFGMDMSGNFVQLPTTLDTLNNTAVAQADLSRFPDYTLGVVLDLQAPYITAVSQLENTTDELGPYTVTASVVDNVLVRNVRLYWALEGGQFSPVTMSPVSGQLNRYKGQIPGVSEGHTVLYYVEANDSTHVVTDPVQAPSGTYSFSILIDGVTQVLGGDVDGNSKVDVFDLLSLLKMLSGTTSANAAADVDGNGKVDVFDLLALLKKMAGQ